MLCSTCILYPFYLSSLWLVRENRWLDLNLLINIPLKFKWIFSSDITCIIHMPQISSCFCIICMISLRHINLIQSIFDCLFWRTQRWMDVWFNNWWWSVSAMLLALLTVMWYWSDNVEHHFIVFFISSFNFCYPYFILNWFCNVLIILIYLWVSFLFFLIRAWKFWFKIWDFIRRSDWWRRLLWRSESVFLDIWTWLKFFTFNF